ncbi:hypothetical protein NHX12_002667, partial [Muraenolepis orangiensis]
GLLACYLMEDPSRGPAGLLPHGGPLQRTPPPLMFAVVDVRLKLCSLQTAVISVRSRRHQEASL